MSETPLSALKELHGLRTSFDPSTPSRKRQLLRVLGRRRLDRAADVRALHEMLRFMRAYPDDAETLDVVDALLRAFGARSDLRRHRAELADSGIAGTVTRYAFYWFTARWLARRWPRRLTIEWSDFDRKTRIEDLLHLLILYGETPAADEFAFTPREWIERLKHPDETDATFLVNRFDALRMDRFARETFFEELDVPMALHPGPDTPARTTAWIAGAPIVFQRTALRTERPSLRKAVTITPERVRFLTPRDARAHIDLAQSLMVSHRRDLDVFVHADPDDTRVVDFEDGYRHACYGAIPERRLLIEALYGYVVLKNGVPIAYGTISPLFNSAAVAFNVFDPFRGGESARVFGQVLALTRALFDVNAFSLDPYQLGYDNEEGLRSGAWWFYFKLGFRPHAPEVKRLLARELVRQKKNPRHRSSMATLRKLTAESMFWYLDRPRSDVLGRVSLAGAGLAVVDLVAARFGSDREHASRVCAEEASRLLGVRAPGGPSAGERLAWARWAPLVLCLPGVARWSSARKRALAAIVRAKGGRRESDFVSRFDAHHGLRRAILDLAARD